MVIVKYVITFSFYVVLLCDRPMKNILFKPLREHMLEEPFWLGITRVTVDLICNKCYI